MVIDNFGNIQDFRLILSKRNYEHLGQLCNVDISSLVVEMNLNSADEISFEVDKEMNGVIDPLWNNITDFKLIYIPDIDEYFQIEVTIEDSSNGIIKTITGTSLCEAELSQTTLYDIEINSEDDIARTDYVVTKFYSQDDYKNCLLGRVLSKAPHYKVGHVDKSLWNIQRTYSISDKTIYDFLTGDCAEQTNCIFRFDSTSRTINVYDLYTVCEDCGQRGTFYDVCPKCGSANLKYFGEDTTIYVDRDNLSDEIQLETDTDSIKNTFRLEAGDDDMTAAVINMNPNGSQYLYYFSEETLSDMSEDLRNCIAEYNKDLESKTEEYEKNAELLYETIDKIQYYTSSMMPEHKTQEMSASQQAKLLNTENLSPTAIQSVTSSTSVATANSAISNYAKVYIKTGYYKVEVKTGKFVYIGKDSNGYNYGNWTGNFTVTSYSDDEDTADSEVITVKITEQYDAFLQQKIDKLIAKEDDDQMSIYDVLSTNHTLESFAKAITYYSLNRLKSFYDAIQTCLDVLVESDQASSSADFYKDLYVPYKQKLQVCQAEIDTRNKIIDEWTQKYDSYIKVRNDIQKSLNLKSYLDKRGDNLYTEFCSFRREDTYQNSNYVSDGLQNAQIFDNAKQFLSAAKKSIVESGEYQHTLSSSLYNLLLIDAFKPLVDSFELGNWIRVGIEDKIYRLRLTSYTLKFSSLSKISVSFSDLTVSADGYNDIKSILSKTKSMSTSFSYVETQAENGGDAGVILNTWKQNSLNTALYSITSNDSSNITIDKHGILGRSYDDINNTYSDEQIRINNNMIAFTDDNWNTVRTALGKITYDFNGTTKTTYGLNADTVISGTIIGGDIYSLNYRVQGEIKGSHLNLNTGEFQIGDGRIIYKKNSDGNYTLSMNNVSLDFSSTENSGGSNLTQALSDASKVATNYLYYDSTNGLVISENGKANPSGSYTSISSSGVTIGSGEKKSLVLSDSAIELYKPNSSEIAFSVNNQGSLITNSEYTITYDQNSDSGESHTITKTVPAFEVTSDGIIRSKGGLSNNAIQIDGGSLYLPQALSAGGDNSVGGIYFDENPVIQAGLFPFGDVLIQSVFNKRSNQGYSNYRSMSIGGNGVDQVDINNPTFIWNQMKVGGNIDARTIGEDAGLAYSYIGKLGNIYDVNSRPYSANITPTESNDGGLLTFKATSNMKENKPATDGHIVHFEWDSNDGYDSQFFIGNKGTCAQVRGMNGYTTEQVGIHSIKKYVWGTWKYLPVANFAGMELKQITGNIALTEKYGSAGLKYKMYTYPISGFQSVTSVIADVKSVNGLLNCQVTSFTTSSVAVYLWGDIGNNTSVSVTVSLLIIGQRAFS